MKYVNAVIIAAVLIIIYLLYTKSVGEYLTVKSKYDNEYYNILQLRRGQNDKDIADLLSVVNNKTLKFLEYLKLKYKINNVYSDAQAFDNTDYSNLAFYGEIPAGSPGNSLTQEIVRRILTRYNYEELYETEPTGANGTSYTINKGDKMYICIRQKDTYALHDIHEIMFVILHELSHIGNVGWEHERDFWEVFKFVLHEAELSGIFKNINYKNNEIVYCGLKIDYNPYFDDSIRNIWLL